MQSADRAASHVVVVSPMKSTGTSILLTFLFGPLGMLYSTVTGAVVMAIVSVVVGVLTLGIGLLLTWPICVVWGVMAANAHNERMIGSTVGR